jgi:hypothetical protein
MIPTKYVVNNSGGVKTVFHYDAASREFTSQQVQDVEPIMEANKAVAGEAQKSDWGRHVARVPSVIVTKWLQDEWDRGNVNLKWSSPEFAQIIKKKLDDPDNRAWRVDNPSNPFFIGHKK